MILIEENNAMRWNEIPIDGLPTTQLYFMLDSMGGMGYHSVFENDPIEMHSIINILPWQVHVHECIPTSDQTRILPSDIINPELTYGENFH